MLKPPNVERKLVEQNISTKAVYELPFKVTIENKLRCYQYKVVNNLKNSTLYTFLFRPHRCGTTVCLATKLFIRCNTLNTCVLFQYDFF